MKYVFDTNSLSNVLNHYYVERFPTFWEKFNAKIQGGNLVSVREAKFELQGKFDNDAIEHLSKFNPDFFADPTNEELEFISEIYAITHFRQNLDRKKLLQGGFFADPFIIAKARKTNDGAVVTEEEFKDHGAKIPNICRHFGIPCWTLEEFLEQENWRF